jgi:hypothetical protein
MQCFQIPESAYPHINAQDSKEIVQKKPSAQAFIRHQRRFWLRRRRSRHHAIVTRRMRAMQGLANFTKTQYKKVSS